MKAARYLVLPVLLVATALSCGGGQDPCQVVGCRADAGTPNADASTTEAGPDGGTVDPPPAGCDTPNEPLKNPEKCLVDGLGVYVSPTGDDANPGTKAKPVKTIAGALKLENVQKRILMCEGEYGGSVEITKEISIVGGLACDFTKAGARAKIVASQPAYAVKIGKVTAPVLLSDVEVIGLSGKLPGESSIGLFVSESQDVKVTRVRIEAGDGADAGTKKDGNFTYPDAALLKGADAASGGVGGATGSCPGGGSSSGGAGGAAGFDGKPANPVPPGGAAGTVSSCQSESKGGANGAAGQEGLTNPGAAKNGTLDANGWTGASGASGAAGGAGGGGGGGGGYTGAGGGGGAGGCGGEGGKGGTPGGSSLALVSYASTVAISGSELIAKAAKAGGAGGAGQPGQMGGFKGNGSGGACSGGNGANGGDGGAGGGGAGGIAAGIAWAGTNAPTTDGATKITRPTSAAPAGGPGGAASNKGAEGAHVDVYPVK
jgi:hypothetical protein